MKRLNFYFVMFALFAIVFNGCKKDDDSTSSTNGFTYDGKFYETSVGVRIYDREIIVELGDVNTLESETDPKNLVALHWKSSTNVLIPTNTYTYNSSSTTNLSLFEFYFLANNLSLTPTSGSVTVVKSTDSFIEFTYTAIVNGKTITGKFSGNYATKLDK